MDFTIYVETIISKLEDAGYYSEIDVEELKDSIEEYLTVEYNKKIEIASFDYDMSRSKGSPQDLELLQERFSIIKSEMVSIVREISRTEL